MDTKRRTCRICLIEKTIKEISLIDISDEVEQLANIDLKDSFYYPMFICVTCASDIRFALRVKNKILESVSFVNAEIERLSERDDAVLSIDSNSNSSSIQVSENYRDPEAEVLQSSSEKVKIEDEVKVKNFQNEENMDVSSFLEVQSSGGLTQKNEFKMFSFEHAFADELNENFKVATSKKSAKRLFKVPDLESEIFGASSSKKKFAPTKKNRILKQKSAIKKAYVGRQVFCDHCEHTTHNKKDLMLHLFKHFDIKNFSCEFCDRQFRSDVNLTYHRNSVHLNLRCEKCKKIMGKRETLDDHHCKIDKYRCRFCQKTFVNSSTLNRHIRNVHFNLKCNECHQRFSSAALKENHDCNKYRCNYCQRIFSTSSSLKSHTKSFHLDLKCKKCLQIFASAALKENHTCEAQNNYQCNICEKNFARSTGLKIHTKTKHLNLKCRKCGKVFASEALKESHDCKTDEYRCTLCPKIFMKPQALRAHTANVHLNLKCKKCNKIFESTALKENHDCKMEKFNCDMCQKSFSKSTNLKLHIRIIHLKLNCKKCHKTFSSEALKENHDCQIKEYQCNICQQKFSASSSLARHIGKFHSNLDIDEKNQNSSAVKQE